MELGASLSFEQNLQLKLTPELRQSLNLLQYSSMELRDYLYQQEMENPLLEVNEPQDNDFFAGNNRDTSMIFSSSGSKDNYLEFGASDHETLENYLMDQLLSLKEITDTQKNILRFMIYNLNEAGFLEIELAIIARIFKVSLGEVEHVLSYLQSLEPVGVGARNFKECLLIQLHSKALGDSLAYRIVETHLEDAGQKKYMKLAEYFGVSLQNIQAAIDLIQTLNPRPCSQFSTSVTSYIEPDVIVERVNQEYMVVVNDDMIPTLSINEAYKNLRNNSTKEVNKYIKEKYQDVLTLMNGLAQRKLTLYKVTKAIVEKQGAFIQEGIMGLKPMTLSVIATELGYHESTISRAISNKYIQTPHGLFKIRSLFTVGVSTTTCFEMESPVVIKEKIRKLINQEDKRKPLSDQMLLKLLEREGITIARRTVAKYREEIGVQNSTKRKRF